MAGFEVIVRPVIFPNIRPQAPRALAPEDDPTQGFAEIGGGGGQLIDLPYTWSYNMSRSMQQVEHGRASDKVRVYQEEDKGSGKRASARVSVYQGEAKGSDNSKTINKDNYVDINVMKAVLVGDADGKEDLHEIQYRPVDEPALPRNVEILERDIIEWWNSA
jgi:hypothetical protein